MSLIDECMTRCIMLVRIAEPDGEGGQKITWVEGERFGAVLCPQPASLMLLAEKETPQRSCEVITCLPKVLKLGDVFRCEADGAVFRVLSDSEDRKAPPSAGLQLARCRAERWELI